MTSRFHLVTVGADTPTPNLEIASAALRRRGFEPTPLTLPASGLPRGIARSYKHTLRRFTHTPAPLIESWRVAQRVVASTQPGDIIVIGDEAGVGGVLALIEAARPAGERRRLWTVAGDGLALRTAQIAGTIDGLDMSQASEVDWELVQYRHASEVLATSELAVQILGDLAITAHLITGSLPPQPPAGPRADGGFWAPGAVSRASRSGEVMRAVASLPEGRLTVSTHDMSDGIWSGSTWESLYGVRAVLGDRLRRGDRPTSQPDAVIVGDPLTPPDAVTSSWRDSGVPTLVSGGSVAAAMWPEALTWANEDDLAALLAGKGAPSMARAATWSGPTDTPPGDESRARRVSVGVPVFRSVAFLDECVESILAQDQSPYEVVLIDDGSASPTVESALASWQNRAPDLIRIDRQPNRGVCVARNRLVESMTGDAFLLIDQDDVLEPSFISRTAGALRHDTSLWAVATWTEFFGDYEGIEAKPPFDRRVGLRENPIVSTAVLVDMSVRDAGIRFAPDLAFLYCEDWHVWSQIIAAGGRMGLVPEPLVRHRVHPASGGFQRTELAYRIGKARAVEPLLAKS